MSQLNVFSPTSSTLVHRWFSTYWTCSPGARCRSGSRQSRCRSYYQRTSGRSAAAGCCSAACLHLKQRSSRTHNIVDSLTPDLCSITCPKRANAASDSHLQLWVPCGARRRTFSPTGRCQRTGRASETRAGVSNTNQSQHPTAHNITKICTSFITSSYYLDLKFTILPTFLFQNNTKPFKYAYVILFYDIISSFSWCFYDYGLVVQVFKSWT